MASGAIMVRCPACAQSWPVPRRGDGTAPKTARCALSRGGCGHVVKVPAQHSAARLAPAVNLAWDPASEPRSARETAEQCPRCSRAGLLTSPRNTVRVCLGCKCKVTPAGVAAPYERGPADAGRRVKTQRESDLEALDLAGRKGVMLAQLASVGADDRLDPASLPKVEWFADQVKAAATGQRLDDLAGLFGEAGIRRRRFWHGQPEAITAGYDDDQDEDDGQGDDDGQAAPALATPASIAGQLHRAQPQRATWPEALAANGWRLYPVAQWDGCQVVAANGHRCTDQQTPHRVGAGWACSPHYSALCVTMNSLNTARGITW